MNTRNYLHLRRHPHTQAAHDRAFLRMLIALISICVLAVIVGKAKGYGQQTPQAPTAVPATAAPVKSVATPVAVPVPAPVPKSPYQPTDSQSDKLRIAQLEALNAQQAWFTAAQKLPEYQTFLQAVGAIDGLCQKTKADNKWPVDVVCNKDANPITFGKQTTVASTEAKP